MCRGDNNQKSSLLSSAEDSEKHSLIVSGSFTLNGSCKEFVVAALVGLFHVFQINLRGMHLDQWKTARKGRGCLRSGNDRQLLLLMLKGVRWKGPTRYPPAQMKDQVLSD